MAWYDTLISGMNTAGKVLDATRPFLQAGGSIYNANQQRNALGDAFGQYADYANQGLQDFQRFTQEGVQQYQDYSDRAMQGYTDAYNTARGDLSGAMGSVNQAFQTAVGAQKPYTRAGSEAVSGYQNLLRDPNRITSDPGYQFRFDQGAEAQRRAQAATGFRGSGNQQIALTEYGQNYATNELDRALNRYQPLISAGLQGAGNVASAAQAHAAGITGVSNSLANLARGLGETTVGINQNVGAVRLGANQALGQAYQQNQENLGKLAYGTTLSQSGANTQMLRDLLGLTPGGTNLLTGLADVGQGVVDMVNGSGATFDANTGQITGDITGGLNISGVGTIPYADLLSAGGGTAAGAMEAANLIASETAAGAGTWADLSTGPNTIAGMTGTSGAGGGMSSVTGFLSSAPGMGLVSGLITGVTTGDWGKAATTGLGTAAGAKLGSMVMPGIGTMAGGVLGALFGGSIGPKPSNRSAGVALRLNEGEYDYEAMTGKKSPDPAQTEFVENVGKSTTEMVKVIKDVFPDMHFPEFSVEVGQRDGLNIYHGQENGKPKRHHYGQDIERFSQGIADTIFTNIRRTEGGLTPWQKDAISRVNYADPEIAKQQLQLIKGNPNGLGGNMTSP